MLRYSTHNCMLNMGEDRGGLLLLDDTVITNSETSLNGPSMTGQTWPL